MIAAAIRLIDVAVLRAGHEMYAGEESGRGAATLLKRHVQIDADTIRLSFRGKGGKRIEKMFTDPPLLEVMTRLRRLRGRRLFIDPSPSLKPLTANDINAWLREATGQAISAKDFRTFHATSHALEVLAMAGPPASERHAKKLLSEVARAVAQILANTPTVARKSYIHPSVMSAYERGALDQTLIHPARRRGLTGAETALMRFIEREFFD